MNGRWTSRSQAPGARGPHRVRRVLVASALGIVALTPSTAFADHGGGGVYGHIWSLEGSGNPFPVPHIGYYIDDDVPDELWQTDIIHDAGTEWTNVTGSRLDYDFEGFTDDDRWRDGSCNLYGDVVIQYADLEDANWDDDFAQTSHCHFDSGGERFMFGADIRISNDWRGRDNPEGAEFYFGRGTPPNNLTDAWSVITHEFGHATGRVEDNGANEGDNGHYANGEEYPVEDERACDEPGGYATMCTFTYPGWTTWRALTDHDESALRTQSP